KDIGVATQRPNALLNPGATRIVQANHGRANAHGVVHYFTDFLRVSFGKGSSKNRKILCENINKTAVDGAITRNHTIAVIHFVLHIKVGGSMGYEDAHF